MNISGLKDGSLLQTIAIDSMKKAEKVQEHEVLAALESAGGTQPPAQPQPSQPAPQAVAELTGLGTQIDVRG